MDAEGDIEAATAAQSSRLKICLRHPEKQVADSAPQLTAIEKDLMTSVDELQRRKQIFGEPPTVEDVIQPPEERDGDTKEVEVHDDVEIVAKIKQRVSIESGGVRRRRRCRG